MAVIVSPALSPCHISPNLPSPTLDLALSPSTPEFSTPRSLHGIDIVAAAATLTPLSNPVIDPTTSHEYCLSTKRSHDECEGSVFGVEHESKRLRLDDTYVPAYHDSSVVTSDEQFFGVVNVAIDDPLATDLYNASFAPPPPIPVSYLPEDLYFSTDCTPPVQSSSSSLFPEQHVVIPSPSFDVEVESVSPASFQSTTLSTEIELVDEDAEGDIDDELFPPITRSLQPIPRRWQPVHEPSLWQLICKVRVENVKKAFPSFAEFKAAVDRETQPREPVTFPQVPPVSSSSPSSDSHSTPTNQASQEEESSESAPGEVVDLTDPRDDVIPADESESRHENQNEKTQDAFRVEICTPSDFKDEFKTEVVITPDVDVDTEMRSAFDDWDSEDSESDEDDDEGDYDLESEEDDSLTSPHESLVFNFPLPPYSNNHEYDSSDPSDEPMLEDAMRNQCVQTRMVPRGTPSRAPVWASGSLPALKASRASRAMS